MSNPEHPTVDWTMTRRGPSGRTEVMVTCPACGTQRFLHAGTVAYRTRRGTFNGRCFKDRVLNIEHIGGRYGPRKPRLSHPAVDWTDTKVLEVASRLHVTVVAVTCPVCQVKRYSRPGPVAAKIRTGHYTGRCLPCSPNARKREWVLLGPGRRLDPVKGYVRLSAEAIAPEDLWLYKAMTGRVSFVSEHRFVMAKALGRPLGSHELIDHMDGDKTNNDPSNLRLYRRGRNEPGDTSGYGAYYHEWQLALAEVQRLRDASETRS